MSLYEVERKVVKDLLDTMKSLSTATDKSALRTFLIEGLNEGDYSHAINLANELSAEWTQLYSDIVDLAESMARVRSTITL
jgi:hypothetical protein